MKGKNISAPFLSVPITSLKVGLNQLGMRSVGVQLFTLLLPGLNNVSEPLRDYAFYCWILNHLFKDLNPQRITLTDFRKYVRSAEYLLALVCSDQGGVPGVTLARTIKEKQPDSYLLAEGTDGTGIDVDNHTYFKNPGGAFLQYFASSMVDIGLIHIVERNGKPTPIYNTTLRGEKLGKEFGKAIGSDAEGLFFEAHHSGQVGIKELGILREKIDMHKPSNESGEWQMLVDILLKADFIDRNKENETFHRRRTIQFLLEWIDTEPYELRDIAFVEYLLDCFYASEERCDTLWGWYAYGVNEEWQYQSSFVFSELLQKYLEPRGAQWHRIDEVVEKMAHDMVLDIGTTDETPLSQIIDKAEDMLSGSLSQSAKAVINLLRNYRRNEKVMIQPLQDAFANLTEDTFFGFMQRIRERCDQPFKSFLEFFIKQEIILRHYKESFRKMSQTGVATQKFALESGHIRFLARIEVDHSSPRLGTLINFIRDLDLVKENHLTEAGRNLLKDLNSATL